MSKPTHIVKLRNGKAAAEEATADQLAQMQKAIPGFAKHYEVNPIEAVEKPATLAKAPVKEESKKSE